MIRKINSAYDILRSEGASTLLSMLRLRVARNLMGNQLSNIFPIMGYYTHQDGERIALYAGYRDYIKPLHFLAHTDSTGYRLFFRDNGNDYVQKAGLGGALQFYSFLSNDLQIDIRGKRILDIGCGDGALAYVFAAHGAGEVHGIDVDFSYKQLNPQHHDFLRDAVSRLPVMADHKLEDLERRLTIIEGDIQCPEVAFHGLQGQYDLVVSLSVLEHLPDLRVSLGVMRDLLKTGGMMVHRFNPYFSETGGHEFGILDFPWGHVRLSREKIDHYLATYRSWEKERALSVLDHSFNNPKLTLHEIDELFASYGLNIFYSSESRAYRWQTDSSPDRILQQCRNNYPMVSWRDLTSDNVVRCLRKN